MVTANGPEKGKMLSYQDGLRDQALSLKRLRVERGNKSYSAIKKRTSELFGREASLPPSTQSAAFNGRYVGLDKLMWLVRTLMSWDEYGNECQPPDYRDESLSAWRQRWAEVTALRPSSTSSMAPPTSSLQLGVHGSEKGKTNRETEILEKRVNLPASLRDTVQPYPPGTQWEFSYRKTGFTQVEELCLYAEPNGSTITDDYLPSEINAQALWKMWIIEWADANHNRWPDLYRSGEVHISWFVTRPTIDGIFEGAPHVRDWRTLPGVMDELPGTLTQEDFLTHYTHPVHAETGEPLNWLRLLVLDLGWNGERSNKGGFIQEATGWKPSPLQPTLDVHALGAAAGLYVPPGKR